MQTLEVTDEQHAFIQRLRGELSEQVVGKYGHVRDQDAVQFLIDNLDGDLEIEPDVAFTTAAELAEESSEGGLEEVSYEESETVETDDESEGDEDSDSDSKNADADGSEADADEDPGDADEDAVDETTDDTEDDSSSGAADDDDMLNQMMNLLDTHDDKWEESSAADYRYSVTLPDGDVEHVQTKDDVRALLFKNY